MVKYQKYKEINLPWLKIIPANWDIKRNKQFLHERKKIVGNKSSEYTLLSLTLRGIVVRDLSENKGKIPASFDNYKIVEPGDIAFCLFDIDETPRTVGLSKYKGMLTGAYNIFHIEGINARYLYYYYLALDNIKGLRPLYTGLRKTINVNTFLSQQMPVPPRSEQDQIVRFLDWKVSEINKLIGIRRKEIQELEELRRNVIKTTVTSGLDSVASRKYSGESWIGEIPEKWQTLPIKRLFKIYSGATPKSGVRRYWYGNVIWITPADFKTKDKYVSKGAKTLTDEGLTSCSASIVPAGSIIFSKRAPVGSVVINSNPLCTNQGCLSCVPYSNASAEFFYYVMSICTDEFERRASGTTFKEISLTEFGKFQMPVPSVDEQKTIASFLDDECSRIDKVISIDEEKIAGLKELKNTIVSDVVTGKIDVRNITVPEYEHVDDIVDDNSENNEETETDGEEA